MTAKEYLTIPWNMERQIQRLQERRREVWYAATGVGSSLSKQRGGKGGRHDKVGDSAAALAAIDEQILDIRALQVEQRLDIMDRIEQMKNVQYVELLQRRYLEYKPLLQIAKEMDIAYQYARSQHCLALQAFEKQFPDVLVDEKTVSATGK